MAYGEIREDNVKWYVEDLDRRVSRIEELKPEVLAYEVREIRKEMKSIRSAFYAFAFSVVGSAIIFAFTTFAILGKHA